MSIFSRLSDVINSNIHAMLDKAEDPEKMVRLIIQEMEDTMVEVRSTAVRSLARRKEVARAIERLELDAEDWSRKAELAVTKNRDDLARAALSARERAVERMDAMRRELQNIDGEIAKLEDDIGKLQAQLNDARRRQKSILVRREAVSSRLKVKQQLADRKVFDATVKFEQYQNRIDQMEAEVEAHDLGGPPTLDDEFAALELDDRVEAELKRLRERIRNNGSSAE